MSKLIRGFDLSSPRKRVSSALKTLDSRLHGNDEGARGRFSPWAVVKDSLTTELRSRAAATVKEFLTVQTVQSQSPVTEESSATQFRGVTTLIAHRKRGRHPTIFVAPRKWWSCEAGRRRPA